MFTYLQIPFTSPCVHNPHSSTGFHLLSRMSEIASCFCSLFTLAPTPRSIPIRAARAIFSNMQIDCLSQLKPHQELWMTCNLYKAPCVRVPPTLQPRFPISNVLSVVQPDSFIFLSTTCFFSPLPWSCSSFRSCQWPFLWGNVLASWLVGSLVKCSWCFMALISVL